MHLGEKAAAPSETEAVVTETPDELQTASASGRPLVLMKLCLRQYCYD